MRWAERCFNSLRNSGLVPDVFVVDNGSTDGTQDYIQEHFPEVLFQQSNENLGFGKANNLGLQYALDNDYDYAYLLNQDAWVFPETFEKLIEISHRNPEYGILSPFQMQANMQHIDISFKKNVCSWKSSPDLLDCLYLGYDKEVHSVSNVMAAHWLVTKTCLRKVGGFSPTFPHYGEDDNYIHRALYHGFMIGVVPSLRVVHDRESRKATASMKMYMGYIYSLKILSSINSQGYRWERIFLKSSKLLVRFKSLKPFIYLVKVIAQYNSIKHYRLISMTSDCAFLTSNKSE